MNKTLGISLGKAATATVIKVAIAGVAVLGGTALVSSSVFASLTATATNTSGGSVSTGTLSLTQAASGVAGITGGFTTAITAMGPGDTVKNCTVDWTSAGVCSGTQTTALASTSASALTAAAAALTLPSTLAGAVSHLQIGISLPAGSENVLNGVLPGGTIQGLTTAITWTFNETERTGTTTNS